LLGVAGFLDLGGRNEKNWRASSLFLFASSPN
jgi:hypothetical protein